MTNKRLRKKSESRAAKATNRKNSKATAAKPPGTTKLALLVAHLSAPGGATIAELCKGKRSFRPWNGCRQAHLLR